MRIGSFSFRRRAEGSTRKTDALTRSIFHTHSLQLHAKESNSNIHNNDGEVSPKKAAEYYVCRTNFRIDVHIPSSL